MNDVKIKPLILLTGPSGVGKSTVLKFLLLELPHLQQVPIYTNRPSRSDSETKIVVEDHLFESLRRDDKLLPVMEVYGYKYGISKSHLRNIWEMGKIPITDYVFRFADSLKESVDLTTIYLLPPNRAELLRRLKFRNSCDEERLEKDWEEVDLVLSKMITPEKTIVNKNLAKTISTLVKLLTERY